VSLEIKQDLLEEFPRDIFLVGDFPCQQRIVGARESDEGMEGVFGFL
jgi:hypothetical protein